MLAVTYIRAIAAYRRIRSEAENRIENDPQRLEDPHNARLHFVAEKIVILQAEIAGRKIRHKYRDKQ